MCCVCASMDHIFILSNGPRRLSNTLKPMQNVGFVKKSNYDRNQYSKETKKVQKTQTNTKYPVYLVSLKYKRTNMRNNERLPSIRKVSNEFLKKFEETVFYNFASTCTQFRCGKIYSNVNLVYAYNTKY